MKFIVIVHGPDPVTLAIEAVAVPIGTTLIFTDPAVLDGAVQSAGISIVACEPAV